MQKFLIVFVLAACFLCLAYAQNVNAIKEQIIAQYERLPGESIHYPEEQAHVIYDPAHIDVNF